MMMPPSPPASADKPIGDDLLAGNGGIASLPTWIRAVTIIGIPGAIALFLVWIGAREVPRINVAVERNQVLLTDLQRQLSDQDEHAREMYRMMQRICSNTAKNDDERTRCF